MSDQHAAAPVALPNPVPYGADRRFNLSSWTLDHQALVIFILGLVTLFGILSYGRLAQSEDPPFTFKVMVIRTLWPGATARQVQEEVTDVIARKLQEVLHQSRHQSAIDALRSAFCGRQPDLTWLY